MSGMPIILGTIQRAVMDTVHLVGQGGFRGDFRDGRSDHLTQKR
ncbi:hypothetical protein T12_1389 [Trichinella patagoniensis]|uniref:Uncharacterized protein n=1 Tax=Trichinella patagoniensis TaxID=990121 RepID=A0A0V0Z3R2_9BILA|nr:hypothetical protein T12_1389 [Trichinella patagoniensis]